METELNTLRPAGGLSNDTAKPVASNIPPKRYQVELTNYAWDQSDKFVKLFVTLDNLDQVSEDDVTVVFTDRSIELLVQNLNNKDYKLTINNLLSSIDVSKSYKKVKSDMVAIYAKKSTETVKWSHLTSVEKRVNEIKDSAFKEDDDDEEGDKNDPSTGLMKMMKKMYQSGDDNMKRMIAKAWTEGQEKKGPGAGDMPMGMGMGMDL